MARSALAAVCLFVAVAASSAAALPSRSGGRLRLVPDVPSRYEPNLNIPSNQFVHNVNTNPVQVGLVYAQNTLGGVFNNYEVKNSYVSKQSGVTHIYLKQVINELEVINGDASVHVSADGRVVAFSESFYKGKNIPQLFSSASQKSAFTTDSRVNRSAGDALKILADKMGLSAGYFAPFSNLESVTLSPDSASQDTVLRNVPFAASKEARARLAYIQSDNGASLIPVWDLIIESKDGDMWLNAQVRAESSFFAVDDDLVAVHDWVSDASFTVYPIGVNDPEDGERKLVNNPHLKAKNASPLGWNDQGTDPTTGASRAFTTTRGNNVNAQENTSGRTTWETNYRPDGGNDLAFDFPLDLTLQPDTYVDASVANLFYWNNIIHDVFYQYGFDEESGNFQENNFGRGGAENDAVISNAMDGSGTNNANFATPPDGSPGKMRMYVWTNSSPKRDGDLDSGIIIHEYAHGISTRLTGGPANSNCLQSGEAGGMGEGWGDTFATLLRMRPEYERGIVLPMAPYSSNKVAGIRKFPYSTDFSVNPSTYTFITLTGYEGVHAKGEVWANTLLESYWEVVESKGFSSDWYKGKKGNNQFLADVVEGLKLQPCRPTFVDARDAILLADTLLHEGSNVCALWRGFARRGLGVKAEAGGIEDYTLPEECNV